MKYKIFLQIIGVAFCCSIYSIHAQTIEYAYDANGARTGRTVVNLTKTRSMVEEQFVFEDKMGEDQISVTANYQNKEMSIHFSNNELAENITGALYDMSGRLLPTIQSSSNPLMVSLSAYPLGTYILKIQNKSVKKDFKIINK